MVFNFFFNYYESFFFIIVNQTEHVRDMGLLLQGMGVDVVSLKYIF